MNVHKKIACKVVFTGDYFHITYTKYRVIET